MSDENKQKLIEENQDSTPKKLIYQVPFREVQSMSAILKQLEDTLLDKIYIDVEVNSLEDAYINIAREEEKLQQGDILPESNDDAKFESDLQTYMEM